MCVCVTVKIQFGNASTHHTHPPLGRYARSRDWAPRIQKFWIRPWWELSISVIKSDVQGQGHSLSFLLLENGWISIKNIPNCEDKLESPFIVYVEAKTQSEINTNFTIVPLNVHLKLEKCYNRHRRKLVIPNQVSNTQYIGVHVKTDFATCLASKTKVLSIKQFIPGHLSNCVHFFSAKPGFLNQGFSIEQSTGDVLTTKTVCLHRKYTHFDVLVESHCDNSPVSVQQVKIVFFSPQKEYTFAGLHSVRHAVRLRRSTSNTPPKFDRYSYTKYVPEEENAGYIVDTITASDPDSGHSGPPIFTCKNYLESYIYPYDNTYSSYIDLKYLLCVCVTVKIQFGNASTHHTHPPLGRYARSRDWAPRIQKFWIRPWCELSISVIKSDVQGQGHSI